MLQVQQWFIDQLKHEVIENLNKKMPVLLKTCQFRTMRLALLKFKFKFTDYGSLIDHIYTNVPETEILSFGTQEAYYSDHKPIFITVSAWGCKVLPLQQMSWLYVGKVMQQHHLELVLIFANCKRSRLFFSSLVPGKLEWNFLEFSSSF